jgi:uncharacterized protein
MTERSSAIARQFTPAPIVEGIDRRIVHIRTPDGISLAGTLRVPQDAPLPAPAVLISPPGPVAVSDQSVVAGYADRLTAAGYVTLAIDPRNLGHSGGSPRQHFDMMDRLRDLQFAVSYLTTLTDLVDAARIGTFGASAGATAALVLAGYDARITAFVGACGGYFNPHLMRDMLGDLYDQQRHEVAADLQRYHTTGDLTYIPVVTSDGDGAFLAGIQPHPTEPFDYYGTERGAGDRFENRVTTISRHTLLNFDCLSPADFMGSRAGLLLVGTDDVYVPIEGTNEAYRRLTGPKDLVTIQGANHIDFYDNDPVVTAVMEATLAWFGEHL